MKMKLKDYIIYIQKYGYKVIKTSNVTGYGIDELKKILKNNTTAFARTIRSTENRL